MINKEYILTGKIKVRVEPLDGNNGYILLLYHINNAVVYDQLFIDCSGGFLKERKDEVLDFLDSLNVEYEVEELEEINA